MNAKDIPFRAHMSPDFVGSFDAYEPEIPLKNAVRNSLDPHSVPLDSDLG